MLSKLPEYFNIMAQLISFLERKSNLNEIEIDLILNNRKNQYHELLRTYIPELLQSDNQFINVSPAMLTETFYHHIQMIISGKNAYLYLLLLYYMDKAIIRYLNRTNNIEEDFEEISPLNTNITTTNIALFQKVKCNWDTNSAGFQLSGFLTNFYYLKPDTLCGLTLKNYLLDPDLIINRSKKNLKIAISPVTKDKTICPGKEYTRLHTGTKVKQHFFNVEGLQNEDQICSHIKENILAAGKEGADILVFPEMLGSRNMLDKITASMSKSQSRKPALVIFPSIWKKTKDNVDNTNTSYLLLHGEEIILKQPKRYRFHMPKDHCTNVYEDINCEKHNEISFLHIEELGRICIVICYDFLEDSNREMILSQLMPSIICTPSFSTGSFHFARLSGSCLAHNCNWIWCNTCSAAWVGGNAANYQSIGVITKLSKYCNLLEESPFYDSFRGTGFCKKDNCRHCIYYTNIPLKLSAKNLSSSNHHMIEQEDSDYEK